MSFPAALLPAINGAGGTVGKIVGGAGSAVVAFFGIFFRVILEGERGFLTRFGRPLTYKKDAVLKDGTKVKAGDVVVLRPGGHPNVPVWRAIRVIDVKIQGIDLPVRTIEDANGIQYIVEASLEWRRGETGADLRRTELGVTNELELVTNRVANAIMDVIRASSTPTLPPSDVISDRVVEACSESIREESGLEVLRIRLTGLARSSAQLIRDGMLDQADRLNGGYHNRSVQTFALPVPMND